VDAGGAQSALGGTAAKKERKKVKKKKKKQKKKQMKKQMKKKRDPAEELAARFRKWYATQHPGEAVAPAMIRQ
jgi:DNA segregation ATPase FtsK/SpoIIIE-like protein